MKRALALLALLSVASPAYADPIAEDSVPPDLRPWIPWVVDGDETYGCTTVGGQLQCSWPGVLTLDLGASGGRFRQEVVADRALDVWLPGDAERWPFDVRVDGRPASVLDHGDDLPYVRVDAGTHRIEGALRWRELPEVLRVPTEVATIALTIDRERVSMPRRNEEGMLWLRSRDTQEGDEGHLELEVFRRLTDGVPFRMSTIVRVRASGRPREVTLDGAVVPGFTAVQLASSLPVRLTPAGRLVVQVRAGTFEVEIVGMRGTPPTEVSAPEVESLWAEHEIWIFEASETLRQVEIDGVPSIDPARTNLPEGWQGFPTYVLSANARMTLRTTRRGEPTPPPNSLSLRRQLWLDLDGRGYTARDSLSGTLSQGFRLDLVEGELGRVDVGGVPQLVTVREDRTGIEVRTAHLSLTADSRLERAVETLPAVGWSEDVQSLEAELHLPPGWTLLHVGGADDASGAWIAQWDLFALFFVLVVAIALGRLYGPVAGLLGLVGLALTYHEPDAPRWVWVTLIVLGAVLAVVPTGRFRSSARFLFFVTLLSLVLIVVPFVVLQLRSAQYPQLASESRGLDFGFVPGPAAMLEEEPAPSDWDQEGGAGMVAPGAPPPAAMPVEAPMGEASRDEGQMGRVQRRADGSADTLAGVLGSYGSGGGSVGGVLRGPDRSEGWVDPNAVVQTGPGVPRWSWQTIFLSWSGPVTKEHVLQLWLLSPQQFRALAVLRVVFLLGLLLIVLRRLPPKEHDRKRLRHDSMAAAAAVALLAFLAPAPSAHAQTPPPDLLADLQARLTRPPSCSPECVDASLMSLRVQGDRATLQIDVNAGTRAAYRIPGPADAWAPERIRVDGRDAVGLVRFDDGFLFLRLEPGVHRVELEGPIAGDALTLAFGEPPRQLEVDADGWEIEGLRSDGRPTESVQLRRRLPSEAGGDAAPQALPEWLVVHRRFEIGVRWTIVSTAQRITPIGSAVVTRLPLLEGESVTTDDVLVEGQETVVSFGRDATEVTWTSVLSPRDALTLVAREQGRINEVWTLACSPIWHCTTDGLDPIRKDDESRYEPEVHPWPGERLTIRFDRPAAAEGQSTTIDEATLALSPGERMLIASLTAVVRTSAGGSLPITLPEGARVRSVTVDGATRPLQQQDNVVRVTLHPGEQRVGLEWQQTQALGASFVGPVVKIGEQVANARVQINMPYASRWTSPSARWVLFVWGPSWGPAILFWSYLALVLIVALGLGLTRRTPLGIGEWLLLGLGLTQIDAWAALLIVLWFFAVAHRAKHPDWSPPRFDLRQLALVGFTFVALGLLYWAVHKGLVGDPDMGLVSGDGSGNLLSWYVDRTSGELPRPGVFSLPLWIWKLLTLAWALWLAWRVVHWARWSWRAFSAGGLWKRVGTAKVPGVAAVADAPIGTRDDTPKIVKTARTGQARISAAEAKAAEPAPPPEAPAAPTEPAERAEPAAEDDGAKSEEPKKDPESPD